MKLFNELETQHGLPSGLLNAVMKQESGGNTRAVSPKGARGAFQFMPATAKQYGVDVNDLTSSAKGAARMYADLLKQNGGDLNKALAGYNWGQGNVQRKGLEAMPAETRKYIQKVTANMKPQAANPFDQFDAVEAKSEPNPFDQFDNAPEAKPTARSGGGMKDTAVDTLAGIGTGVGQVGLGAQKYLGKYAKAIGADTVGDWLMNDAEQGREKLAGELAPHKARSPIAAGAGEIGGNIVATLPVGGGLAKVPQALSKLPMLASQAPKLNAAATALRTGGFRTGLPAATTTAGKVGQMALRSGAGAAVGGASAGLVNEDSAGMGALIGGALPPGLKALGMAGGAAKRVISPAVPEQTRKAVESARGAGYVIPPSQAKPTFTNRLLEGIGGKLTTAQNASAKNQQITNTLAQKAIGAPELSEAGLHQVRTAANQAYDELGSVGKFVADDSFTKALDNAGASTAALQKNFPELVNNEVDTLISGLKSRGEFDAQPMIEAIKQFRSSAAGNKASQDPAKKALGRTQNKIASALEDLIDRNLQQTGQTALLNNYRSARQTLAKVYDVEKAMNKGSGNVDAVKLANALAKGRPLTGELKDVAEFASRFPKAVQTVDKMGSLPQTSPLDWIAALTGSAATGNLLPMAGLMVRPAARGAALSGVVQNRLASPQNPSTIGNLLMNPKAQQLMYRSAPVTGAQITAR